MTPAATAVAQSALYLAHDGTSTAAVRVKDGDPERAIAEIGKAIEALERAQRALRGW